MTAGIVVGAVLGTLVGQLVLYLRRMHKEGTGRDNFLALGLIGLAYGVSILVHGYGFLAVFAAGVALRRLEQRAPVSSKASAKVVEKAHAHPDAAKAKEAATDPQHAPAFMAHAVLSFNEQIERIGEVAAVIAIGMLLWAVQWREASWPFVLAMLVVVRPLSVVLGLARSKTSLSQRALIGWFGIRGIGSLYYLMYAVNHGLDPALASRLGALVLSVMVVSIVVHGISVTPLMALYEKAKPSKRERA